MRATGDQRKRAAVSGIVAGVILFALVFTVGAGFFFYINHTTNLVNQADASKQNSIAQSSMENISLSATISGGTITVNAINRGGVSVSMLDAFVDNGNGQIESPGVVALSSLAVPPQSTLNIGQTTSFALTGTWTSSGTVSVITGRGNTFTTQYPPPPQTVVTNVVQSSVTTSEYVTVGASGSNALVALMTAQPPLTLSCSNECVSDNITVYNYATTSSVTGISLLPNPPNVTVCGSGNTPGCTASLSQPTCTGPYNSDAQPTSNSLGAYSGTGNAPDIFYLCTFDASTGNVGGFATFSGQVSGTFAATGTEIYSATATSNTIQIGGVANVIGQGAFTANYFFYKYSACQEQPTGGGTSHGNPPVETSAYEYTSTDPCNPQPSQITHYSQMSTADLSDAFLLYSAANSYTAYYVQVTNDFNTTLPILQYSYLFMDPGISGEQYYFLAGAATDYYSSSTSSLHPYYPDYNTTNSVPTLDAYSATTTTCAETYSAVTQTYSTPAPTTCIDVPPGQTVTLTFAACGWDSNTWDWGGDQYADAFDYPGNNCNINSVPAYGGSVPEGQVVSIELSYMYENVPHSQLLPFDGQFILNKYTPTISTQLSTSSVQAGQSITDSATLSGESPSAGGTVQYEYFTSSTCTGAAHDDGSAVTVTLGVVPNSPAETLTTAGSYGFEAVYSGDSQDTGVTSACEPFTVTQATPTISTTLSSTPVAVGQPLTDSAALSGYSGSNVGGTVSFYYSTTNTCPASGPTQVGSAVTVSSSGTATSSSKTFTSAGTYYWYAVYSGDSNNAGATSACETLTVTQPSLTISPTQGPPVTSTTLSGSGYSYSFLYSDCLSTAAATVTCVAGSTSTFTSSVTGTIPLATTVKVPTGTAAGTYYVIVYTGTSVIESATFTVTTPAITLSPAQGPKGITVTVSGSGYSPLTTIGTFTFNGATPAVQTCTLQTTSATGTFTCTFTVPSDAAGSYTVTASGSNVGTVTGDTASATFTISTPAIALSPTQGPAGITVTVTGSGYTPSTAISTFTFNGATPATQTCTAQTTSATGTFSCTFTVPSDAAGSYTVTATGHDGGSDTASATFTISTPAITLAPSQGPKGITVTVSGTGFTPSTAISTFTFNGATPATQTCTAQTTSATGTFSCTFTVPSDAAGVYTVVATGHDGGSDTASASFTITTPTIALSLTQGPAGITVTVTGTGFTPSTAISTFTFNGATPATQTCTAQTTSATGGFSCTFTVPSDAAGAYTIVATGHDGGSDTASTSFTITTPTIMLSATQGHAGVSITVTGSGYTPSTAISTFTFNGATPATQTCTAQTTSATGTFSCTFTVPSDAAGTYTVVATGHDGGSDTASTTFTITTPGITLSPSQGPKGITVTVTGTGYTPTIAISTFTFNGATPATQTCTAQTTSATGGFTCTFTVPSDAAGAYTVVATGSDGGSDSASATFTITTPAITLSPVQGPTGITVTVTGSGYTPSTAISTFTFNGATPATQTCTAQTTSATGGFTCTFTVPSDAAGAYTVVATGSDGGSDTASTTFTITSPAITLTPSQGPKGITVTVTGSGFTPSTAISTFTFNGATPATQTCTAQTTSATGGFSCTFTVPSDAAGSYTVVATGHDGGSDTASKSFTITAPTITLAPTQGLKGVSVTVTGTGFSVSTAISTFTFNGATPATQTCTAQTTSATGGFSCTFTVPSDAAGAYTVVATGSDGGSDTASTTFTITSPAITLTPSQGPKGITVTVSGTGFTPSTAISTFTFNGATPATQTCTAQTTSATGTFSCTFTVPSDAAGAYTVVATGHDGGTDTASATFTITTPAFTVSPTQGPKGITVTVTGSGFTPSTAISTFTFNGATPATQTCTAQTTSATGTFSCTFTVPSDAAGSYTVVATGSDGGSDTASTTFTITTPAIALSSSKAAAGTTGITVTGSGYTPSTAISTFTFGGATPGTQTCTSQTTSATGAFSCTFTVPSDSPKVYSVVATGSDGGSDTASNTFTIPGMAQTATPVTSCTGGTSCSISFSGSVTAGDELVVAIGTRTTSTTCSSVSGSVTDSVGTYTAATTAETEAGSADCAYTVVYYIADTTYTGADTISFTLSSTPTSVVIEAYELAGVAASPTAAVGKGTTGTTLTTSSLATTANAVLIAVGEVSHSSAATVFINTGTTGFTANYDPKTTANPEWVESEYPASAGSTTFSLSTSGTPNSWSETGVEFAYDAAPTTTVSCSPASIALGATAKCTASVMGYSGSIAGETISWTRVSGPAAAELSTNFCTLSAQGSCSVLVQGLRPGQVTVRATYEGDFVNSASAGELELSVIVGSPVLQGATGPTGSVLGSPLSGLISLLSMPCLVISEKAGIPSIGRRSA